MGEHARRRIIALFSEERFVAAYQKVYTEACTDAKTDPVFIKKKIARDGRFQHI
jgi:hypothetical protein